ncbi:MAG: hypothetical protein HYV07_18395 [Deltaproteobacteria bacterium]|nr:hypothetical protein [Deltaproteobacteria bacterium]
MQLISLGLLALFATPEAKDGGWEEVSNSEGILVEKRGVEGTSLVEFRGRGMAEAGLLELAGVLRDNDRKTEWMANCMSNYPVRWRAGTSAVVYHRVGSPAFFIADRDTVMDVKAVWNAAEKSISVVFFGIDDPKAPAVDGVVRMPELRGFWKLRYVGPKQTEVTYQVFADPGGSLPRWLVNWASTDIPLHSILGLRSQVAKAGYEKDRMIVDAAFDLSNLMGSDPVAKGAEPSAAPASN